MLDLDAMRVMVSGRPSVLSRQVTIGRRILMADRARRSAISRQDVTMWGCTDSWRLTAET
ncbi:MAG: hypothetical protein C4346_03150 [Chloroflexota bacterium]